MKSPEKKVYIILCQFYISPKIYYITNKATTSSSTGFIRSLSTAANQIQHLLSPQLIEPQQRMTICQSEHKDRDQVKLDTKFLLKHLFPMCYFLKGFITKHLKYYLNATLIETSPNWVFGLSVFPKIRKVRLSLVRLTASPAAPNSVM